MNNIKTVLILLLFIFQMGFVPAGTYNLTEVVFDLSDVEKVVEIILPGLVLLWGIRKLIKVANRS